MQKPINVTIRVYEAQSKPGYMYDIYDEDLAEIIEDNGLKEPESLDGGIHTGDKLIDAIKMAVSTTEDLINQGIIKNNAA